MNEITINKEKVAEVYQNASAETKEALKALFGNEIEFKRKPTLDDYTTIKTYEDACEALGMVPILNQSDYELTDDNGYMVYFPPSHHRSDEARNHQPCLVGKILDAGAGCRWLKIVLLPRFCTIYPTRD